MPPNSVVTRILADPDTGWALLVLRCRNKVLRPQVAPTETMPSLRQVRSLFAHGDINPGHLTGGVSLHCSAAVMPVAARMDQGLQVQPALGPVEVTALPLPAQHVPQTGV